jgi:hypothetical protein
VPSFSTKYVLNSISRLQMKFVSLKGNTTGVTSGTDTSYPFGAPEFTPGFKWGLCCSNFSFLCRSMVCNHSKYDASFIMCPHSAQSIIIRQVEVMRYKYIRQQDMPPCFINVFCVDSDYNITDNMNAICGRKNSCQFDYKYYRQIPEH